MGQTSEVSSDYMFVNKPQRTMFFSNNIILKLAKILRLKTPKDLIICEVSLTADENYVITSFKYYQDINILKLQLKDFCEFCSSITGVKTSAK